MRSISITFILLVLFVFGSAQIPTSGLVAYYPFNGNANDESGNNINCISNGAIAAVDRFGKPDKAFYFNGSSFLDGGNPVPTLLQLTNEVTVSAWIKLDDVGDGGRIVRVGQNWASSTGYDFYTLYYGSGYQVVALFGGYGEMAGYVFGEKQLNFGVWYHVAFTGSSNGLKMYVNGELVNSGPGPVVPPALAAYENMPFYIGQKDNNGFQRGVMDDIRIYNRELNANEILSLFGNYASPASTPPQISLTLASLSVGQTTIIKGIGFSPGQQAEIKIKAEDGNTLEQTTPIDGTGKFEFPFSATSELSTGFYTVFATDVATNYTINPARYIYVNNGLRILPGEQLRVHAPVANREFRTGQIINIKWSDYLQPTLISFNPQAFNSRYYKIEYSLNNGPWQLVASVLKSGTYKQVNLFNYQQFIINEAGSCQIRVSDQFYPSYAAVSDVFTVLPAPEVGFDCKREWDKSNQVVTYNEPRGVAADGVARFYIKISKKPERTSSIVNVRVDLTDPEEITNDYKLLGKVMAVSAVEKLETYSTEANAINAISATAGFQLNNAFWFWYVAPDDFNRNTSADDFRGIRIVRATFTVNFDDGSSEILTQDIDIVRPPLMLVHGLGGSEDTWKNTVYTGANGSIEYLKNASELFQAGIQINQMYPAAAFVENAKLLLGETSLSGLPLQNSLLNSSQNLNRNSFQNVLSYAKKEQGIAANRVDYVCHSMGGCMLRTAINNFKAKYIPSLEGLGYKNYDSGFVNKLITLNTPHNGSCGADLIADLAPTLSENARTLIHRWAYPELNAFLIESFDKFIPIGDRSAMALYKYSPTPAVKNMRFYSTDAESGQGVRFKETKVKNHLIAGLVATTVQEGTDYIGRELNTIITDYLFNESKSAAKITLKLLNYASFGQFTPLASSTPTLIHDVFNETMSRYLNPAFLESSDMVVPLSSQLAGKERNVMGNTGSVFLGDKMMHTAVTDNIVVGNRIVELLNWPISSYYFSNTIPANSNPYQQGVAQPFILKTNNSDRVSSLSDSLIEYFDTAKIKLITPSYLAERNIDSSIVVKINLKDTTMYKRTILLFQNEEYSTTSFSDTITFNLRVSPSLIDSQIVMVGALYDSAGFLIYHYDVTKIVIRPDSFCQRIIVSPGTKLLNPGESYLPDFNGIHLSYVTNILIDDPALSFTIADTNVVWFNHAARKFFAKDTGSTFVIFSYKGFVDTAYFIITIPSNDNITPKFCPGQSITLVSTDPTNAIYQWQVDEGNGFINLTNGGFYNGVNTDSLVIQNIPTIKRGNKYRCKIVSGPITKFSDIKILRFESIWTGSVDSNWFNSSNWTCSVLPDENTDAVIPKDKPNYPTVNMNTKVNSLRIEKGTTVKLLTGITLDIKSKN